MSLYSYFRSKIGRSLFLLNVVRKTIPKRLLVKITQPYFKAEKKLKDKKTLLIVCNDGFNQGFPNAASLMRIGFARGWAKVCGPAKLISIYNLMKEINLYDKPAVFISSYEFIHLNKSDARKLRRTDLFVWANIHPKKIPEFKRMTLFEDFDFTQWQEAYPKIIEAEPKFMWHSTGKMGMYWFNDWINDGLKWVTIHPAADIERYYPEKNKKKFGHIKMAYVGGYWKEKAQAFELYLRPWENIFFPFGYSPWPYKNYSGQLDERGERQLYSTAGLIPLVTTPAGWLMGEVTERYLKAPACRAFCIADHNQTVRDLFNENELIQAKTPEHFHFLVNDFLKGKIDVEKWVKNSYETVMKKHLYIHRAKQIKEALNSQ